MIQFAFPAFLWALPLLAGPILLHLLQQPHIRHIRFPDIRFLRQTALPREGRRRLHDVLLLLLRLLILASAILLAARPSWIPRRSSTSAATGGHAVILLDCSASMGGHHHLERAKTELLKWGDSLRDHRLTCIKFSDNILSINELQNFQELIDLMDDTHADWTAGKPDVALAEALRRLSTPEEDAKLLIVSDFQHSDWQRVQTALPDTIALHLLDCAAPAEANAGIRSIRVNRLPNGRARIWVDAYNYGHEPVSRALTVRIGEQEKTDTLQLPPHGSHRFAMAFDQAPENGTGHAQLDADDYLADDSRDFAIGGIPPVPALLVADTLTSGGLPFVAEAIKATQENSALVYDVEMATTQELMACDLASCRFIFLLGAAENAIQDDLERLRDAVEAGAWLFVSPGNPSGGFLRRLERLGLLHGQMKGLALQEGQGVGEILPDSPLGRLFGSQPDQDIHLFPIRRCLRIAYPSASQILVKTLEGLPFLAEESVGKGKVICFSIGLDTSWSDFPLTNSFLPLLRELCAEGIDGDYGVIRLSCGEPLPPALATLPTPPDTRSPGVFRCGKWPVEVTVPLSESTTEREELNGLSVRLQAPRQTTVAMETAPTEDGDHPIPLWPSIGTLLALLLAVELLWRLKLDLQQGVQP